MLRTRIAATVLVLTAMAACGGESEDQAEVDEEIAEKIGEQYAADDPGENAASIEAQRTEFVTECMGDEGYDYIAPPAAVAPAESLGMSRRDYTLQYGFGISTNFENLAAQFAQRVDRGHEEDPLMAMSEEERAGYQEAELQCLQDSYIEFGLPWSGSFGFPEGSTIMDRIVAAQEAAVQDPKVEEARQGWSSCMQEQGYQYAALEDMIGPLEERVMPLQEAFYAGLQVLAADGTDVSAVTEEDVLDAAQLEALAALQTDELTVAAAHQHCIDEGHDFEAVLQEVTVEYVAEEFGS